MLLTPSLAQWLSLCSSAFKGFLAFFVNARWLEYNAGTKNNRLLYSPFSACDTPGFQVNYNPGWEPCVCISRINRWTQEKIENANKNAYLLISHAHVSTGFRWILRRFSGTYVRKMPTSWNPVPSLSTGEMYCKDQRTACTANRPWLTTSALPVSSAIKGHFYRHIFGKFMEFWTRQNTVRSKNLAIFWGEYSRSASLASLWKVILAILFANLAQKRQRKVAQTRPPDDAPS